MLFRHCRKRNDDACCSHNSTFQFFTQLRLFVATSSNREPKWLPTKRKNWTKMGQIKNKIRTQIPYFDIRLKIFSLSLPVVLSRCVCALHILAVQRGRPSLNHTQNDAFSSGKLTPTCLHAIVNNVVYHFCFTSLSYVCMHVCVYFRLGTNRPILHAKQEKIKK